MLILLQLSLTKTRTKTKITYVRFVDVTEGERNSSMSSSRRQVDDIRNADDSESVGTPSRPSEQGKTKRAHNDEPPLGAQAQRRDVLNHTASSTHPVAFRALVQHRISAYVTWPAQLDCDVTSGDVSSGVAGYIFRYRAVGDDAGENPTYVVRNLAVNFVLLDNLVPGMHYR